MAEDKADPGEPSRRRIDIAKDQDLRHWSRKLDIPADELVRAVAQFGDDPSRIEQHLHERRSQRDRSTGGSGRS